MSNVLPDSRLREPKATVMHDGVEWEPVFCPNCGKTQGFVSCVSSACMPCRHCSIVHVEELNSLEMPETAFWRRVQEEMLEKYGRVLTQSEADVMAETGQLSPGLLKLDAESPYRATMPSAPTRIPIVHFAAREGLPTLCLDAGLTCNSPANTTCQKCRKHSKFARLVEIERMLQSLRDTNDSCKSPVIEQPKIVEA